MTKKNFLLLALVSAMTLAAAPAVSSGAPIEVSFAGTAVINVNGTIARGLHVIRADRLSVGSYEVDFSRNVRGCTYVATIGNAVSGDVPDPGFVTVAAFGGLKKSVYVATYNGVGDLANRGFHLSVRC
jgi:hypothetical protein